MQRLSGYMRSRAVRWLCLLLVLLMVLAYIHVAPSSPKHDPISQNDLRDLEDILQKNFKPRIDRVGPIDQVKETIKEREISRTTVITSRSQLYSSRSPPLTGKTSRKMVGGRSTLRPPTTRPPVPVKVQATLHTETSAGGIPNVQVKQVSCAKLVDGDPSEMDKAGRYQQRFLKDVIPASQYIKLASDCAKFKQERSYVLKPLSKEEEEFPIAYSLLMFKDVEQAERLLRAIYTPQNSYCIHVDKKSSEEIHRAMHAIAKCFDNVFIASRAIDVQWGWYSVVEPDLVCMQDLYTKNKKWRYFINLTGQEFPLKTNLDLVRILKVYNGANDMEGTVARRNAERTEFIHNGFFPTAQKKEPVPHGIRLTKGSVHITASREFVSFVLHDKRARDFREWVKNTGVPDETFFTSLSHSPHLGVPGAYKGEPETHPEKKPFLTRFKNWGTWPFDYPCSGKRVRMICVFSVGDLKILSQRPEFFANKFYMEFEPLALDCMEELHYNRTREEHMNNLSFDTSYYKQLSFVKNHV